MWLLALWLGLQKVPERFFPESSFVQKYLSSDVIKAAALSSSLFSLSLIFRDTLSMQSVKLNHVGHQKAAVLPPPVIAAPAAHE